MMREDAPPAGDRGAAAMIVDTHAHICDPVFDGDRAAVLARARAAGITAVVAVSETLADARRTLELAERFAEIKPAAGLYPAHLDLEAAAAMVALIRREHHRLAAIGEVGLDYRLVADADGRARQREIFAMFIALARELDLPLNVHSRSAGRHAVDLLLAHGAARVQLHAFDGKAAAALPAVAAGYFFSIPPSLLRSRQKQKLVRRLPLDCLLAETDSPVLGPDPDVRNEPANAAAVITALAELKQVPAAELRAALYANTRRLYGDRVAP
jgi:TatD DNase family protein